MSQARCSWDAATRGPLSGPAREALMAAIDAGWADPTRLYAEGRQARILLDTATESIASSIGARADEIRFTSSPTSARHQAVQGLRPHRPARATAVASAVEHSAILEALDASDLDVALVAVDHDGAVDSGEFVAACSHGAAFACLQAANQEVGTLQPIQDVADRLQSLGVPLLVDASPALGFSAHPTGWSVLTASPESFGGPSGIGIVAVRTGVRWTPPRLKDEPPSVPITAAAAMALEYCVQQRAEQESRIRALVTTMRDALPRLIPDCIPVGATENRLPHILTLTCMYVDGETLVTELDRQGFAVTSGSACVADDRRPSHVLAAMGALTHGNVRLSLPWTTSRAEVDRFLAVLPDVVASARARLR